MCLFLPDDKEQIFGQSERKVKDEDSSPPHSDFISDRSQHLVSVSTVEKLLLPVTVRSSRRVM